MDEHENDSHVSEGRCWEESKSIGVVEKQVPKCPVNSWCGGKGQSHHIEGSEQVYGLELLWLPHRMHDLSAQQNSYIISGYLIVKTLN